MVERAEVEALRKQVEGEVLQPGDDGYDDARSVWNGMVDKRPAVIVRCRTAGDVAAAIGFAREHWLVVSTRGGGHNVAGRAVADEGLMIDCSAMTGVRVDPDARRAYVQPGARWGDVDRATQEHGLATTGGLDSRTGVAGLTLGGGLGYLARKHGMACDNLVGAEVVTASGEVVRASEDQNPELLWALRGGGGGFAVVTEFEFQLHELGPEVAVAQAYVLAEHAEAMLRAYRDFADSAPDEVAAYALALKLPPVEPFPEEHHGAEVVAIVAMYAGDVEEGLEVLGPVVEIDDAILAFAMPMEYTALQSSFDAGAPDGSRYYYKSEYTSELSDEAIAAFAAHAHELPGESTLLGIEPLGGAINRKRHDATAFPHRDSRYLIGVWAGWVDADRDDDMIAWTRRVHAEVVAPFSDGGVYANYLDRDDVDRVGDAFRGNHERLLRIKKEWDPEDVFGGSQLVTLSG